MRDRMKIGTADDEINKTPGSVIGSFGERNGCKYCIQTAPYGTVKVVDVEGVAHFYEDERDVESSPRVKKNPRSKDSNKVGVKITRNLCAKKKSVAPARNSV
jgi:Fe-S-cluster-containing dehydrogenase component